jgi:YfiH family protein
MIYHAPKLLNKLPGITAGFTYAKRDSYNTKESICGLNFGENTGSSMQVIKQNLEVLNHEINDNGNIALADQIHGADVSMISNPGYYTGIDGFITKENSLLVGIKAADCAAILLADPTNDTLAAVHAGWRGAASGILPNTLDRMKKEGSDLSELVCYISPCISVKNFEIGEEVAEKFPSKFINWSIGEKPHLNLKGYLAEQLGDAGVRKYNIEIDPRCTIDDSSFYSYRRERDKAGRMLAFITQTKN